ncbi:MAG TPA: DUF6577 family protein [Clostridia bacterium]|nr:DUF6577 family protein [Clostridia bacterium]
MNYSNEISSAFSNKSVFTRNELKDYIKTQNPTLKDSTVGWILYDLCQQHVIQRVAHDTFKIYDKDSSQKDYKADLSEDAGYILEFLKQQFPLLAFIIWETRAYNEFANHQMARNFIFVEVEKPLGESVFNALHEKNNYTTLYKPSAKEIALYSGTVTVSVLPLTSEAPVNGFNATLEKLLVDLFANKLLDRIVSRSDYPEIYEEAFSKYSINYNLMIRYAKRRNRDAEIKTFIKEKTKITVYVKEKGHD